jgi:hypothetical protein
MDFENYNQLKRADSIGYNDKAMPLGIDDD